MADYRLDCCGGYPNHRTGCSAAAAEWEYEKKARENDRKADSAWKTFFDNMTEEQLFDYADRARSEVERANRWRERQNRAYKYMRDNYKMLKWLDRNRK